MKATSRRVTSLATTRCDWAPEAASAMRLRTMGAGTPSTADRRRTTSELPATSPSASTVWLRRLSTSAVPLAS